MTTTVRCAWANELADVGPAYVLVVMGFIFFELAGVYIGRGVGPIGLLV